MNEVRALELIAKELTGEIHPTEQDELMSWVEYSEANRAFYEETKILWEASEAVETEAIDVDTQQAWQQLESKLDDRPAAKVITMRPRFPWWRVAAAVVLLVGGIVWWQWSDSSLSPAMVEIRTGTGERKELILPDESTVVLNEESVLRYPGRFRERRVELDGEAFFSVVRNPKAPFSVETNSLVTSVLGTRFTVRAYRTEAVVEVEVQEGLVAVQAKEAKKENIKISAGQGVSYRKEERTLSPLTEADPNADAFVDQVLVFTDTPLREVIAAMSDYYGTTLRLEKPGLGNCRVNIIFKGVELDEALEKLSFIANLSINREDGALLLNGQPCD